MNVLRDDFLISYWHFSMEEGEVDALNEGKLSSAVLIHSCVEIVHRASRPTECEVIEKPITPSFFWRSCSFSGSSWRSASTSYTKDNNVFPVSLLSIVFTRRNTGGGKSNCCSELILTVRAEGLSVLTSTEKSSSSKSCLPPSGPFHFPTGSGIFFQAFPSVG